MYGPRIQKSDVFNIINYVVFEVEKRALSPFPQPDTSELNQGMDSIAISSQNRRTADIPEYEGLLRLLSPTPTLQGEDDFQGTAFPMPSNTSPRDDSGFSRQHLVAPPGITSTASRTSKKSKRRRERRRSKKKSRKTIHPPCYPKSISIHFGSSHQRY
ncbi:hypothetical protein TWF718_001562 [Orbilia javanica]